jgi:hypothetical protein
MKKLFYFFIGIIFIFQSYAMAQTNSGYMQSTQPVQEKNASKSQNCFSKRNFGLDFGVGATTLVSDGFTSYAGAVKLKESYPAFAFGIRYLHMMNPYLGFDILKINFQCPFKAMTQDAFMNVQFMTGIRLTTPTFYKCMSGYASARMGYGLHFINLYTHGLAFETEVGLNITKNAFIAFSYNLISNFVNEYYRYDWDSYQYQYINRINHNTFALRIGFNFGQ